MPKYLTGKKLKNLTGIAELTVNLLLLEELASVRVLHINYLFWDRYFLSLHTSIFKYFN